MHRDEAGTIAAGQVSELGFDVRNRVVVSRAVMLRRKAYTLRAVLRSPRRMLGMGRLLRMAVSIVEHRMWDAIPSIDHQCVYSSLSMAGEFG